MPPICVEGAAGSGQMPNSVFLWGSSPLWPISAPSPSLPPLSYCQTSSPGKGKSSSNNVLVDLTKRIDVIETFHTPDLSNRPCTQSCALCPRGHTDNSSWSLNNLLPFSKFVRRHISVLPLSFMIILYTFGKWRKFTYQRF